MRLAVVVSHPIQHFCPQYSSWSTLEDVTICVFFASRHGLAAYHDKNFGRVIQWNELSMDFPHEFFPGAEARDVMGAVDDRVVVERLSAFSPDIVVVYGYSQALQRRTMAWALDRGIPIFLIADSELRAKRNWFKRAAKAFLLPRIFRRVNQFLTVGDANEAYYRNYGVPDHRLVRCCFPIDIKTFNLVLEARLQARKRVRQEHDIPEGHKVLLMVGKLVSWKRQSDLVRFSNYCRAERRDVTVILAGTGQDESSLRALAQDHSPGGVIFAGFVQPRKLIEYYCASDIYVHCSEHEPHSLGISEAIYCGLPAVISDRCGSYGPTDDVRGGLNGYVYPCGDANALSSALIRLIDSHVLREDMGAASREIGLNNQRLAHGRALLQAIENLRFHREGGSSRPSPPDAPVH